MLGEAYGAVSGNEEGSSVKLPCGMSKFPPIAVRHFLFDCSMQSQSLSSELERYEPWFVSESQ